MTDALGLSAKDYAMGMAKKEFGVEDPNAPVGRPQPMPNPALGGRPQWGISTRSNKVKYLTDANGNPLIFDPKVTYIDKMGPQGVYKEARDEKGNLIPEKNVYDIPQEMMSANIELPGGAKGLSVFPKYRGSGMGAGGPGQFIQTAPPEIQKPIKEDDIPLWVHPDTLQSPTPGTSAEEATRQGFKRVTTNAKTQIDSIKGMSEVLSKLGELMMNVFPSKGGIEERIIGGPSRWIGAKAQTSPLATEFDAFTNGTLAPIIRSLGEKGTLADSDIKRAIALMPRLTDSAEVAWGKYKNLIRLFEEIQRSAVQGSKKNVNLMPGKKKEVPSVGYEKLSDEEVLKRLEGK
ncbi:MAG: hypothetical protein EHM49_10470 [Deltaproteobacteria bacterium]|nr:MAG: hypothetical protein EHM49_10470 [Deltaproteobacteria bacterium]